MGVQLMENAMKSILAAMLGVVMLAAAIPASAGVCDHSWQTASDGSRCGDRAADRRPGGK